jgi:hypothetical protein
VKPYEFPGYNLELREVPQGESVEWDDEIVIDSRIEKDRFQQGVRRYAAILDGRAVDVCWAVSDCDYHDCLDGFTIRLGPGDIYFFDYRGIQQKRPAAFCRFRLWSQLVRVMLAEENRRCGGGGEFCSLVSTENRVSNAFHLRNLSAKLAGQLRTRVVFGHPVPIIDAETPAVFIR